MTPTYGITKEQIALYLDRSLSSEEDANFDTLIEVAGQRLSKLLCSDVAYYTSDMRIFPANEGMRSIFTGFVSKVSSISVNGVAVNSNRYTLHQGDATGNYLAWYDNVVFTKPFQRGDVVAIEGDFGFKKIPADLGLVLARLFELRADEVSGVGRLKSKKVEDFSISFGSSSLIDQLIADNSAALASYSQCLGVNIRHGSVRDVC